VQPFCCAFGSFQRYVEEVVQLCRVINDPVCNGSHNKKVVCDSIKNIIDGGCIELVIGEVYPLLTKVLFTGGHGEVQF
jgi:hypothetical protein